MMQAGQSQYCDQRGETRKKCAHFYKQVSKAFKIQFYYTSGIRLSVMLSSTSRQDVKCSLILDGSFDYVKCGQIPKPHEIDL